MIKVKLEKDQLNLEALNKRILMNNKMKKKEYYYQQDYKILIIYCKVIIGENIF